MEDALERTDGPDHKRLLSAVANTVRASMNLPQKSDFEFCSTETEFRKLTEDVKSKLTTMLQDVLTLVHPRTPWSASSDLDDDDKADAVSEACDVLLEHVDMAIDQSRFDKDGNSANEAVQAWTAHRQPSSGKKIRFLHANSVKRPQFSFPDKIDNNQMTVFKPKLRSKPNALVPLESSLALPTQKETSLENQMTTHIKEHLGLGQPGPDIQQYPHPYSAELNAYEVSEDQLKPCEEHMYPAINETRLHWIDTVEALQGLSKKLEEEKDIAIDLEAHSYRTYNSFTCLMQISTRTEDFLIDTLALRAELDILNTSFTNPKIIKVLHGADSDILWLQKDLGLYIVNMFDTGQAMRVLSFPRFSLAYLLQKYCNVKPNKAFQLADWRIRPLSDDMQQYAREDTHYLLYCFDKLRNELVAHGNQNSNLLRAVWLRSRDLCLQRWEKPFYDPASALSLYNKHSRTLNSLQLHVFKVLHQWRDTIARDEDESVRYVLPDHQLIEISAALPRDTAQVLACCQPAGPLVRVHSQTIAEVIASAITAEDTKKAKLDAAEEKSTTLSTESESAAHKTTANTNPDSHSPIIIQPNPSLTTTIADNILPSSKVSNIGCLLSQNLAPLEGIKLDASKLIRNAIEGDALLKALLLFHAPASQNLAREGVEGDQDGTKEVNENKKREAKESKTEDEKEDKSNNTTETVEMVTTPQSDETPALKDMEVFTVASLGKPKNKNKGKKRPAENELSQNANEIDFGLKKRKAKKKKSKQGKKSLPAITAHRFDHGGETNFDPYGGRR
eukprot:m.103186 g.103186  ORF g.103186 m.103186 type:complete len:788 (+) comp13802_c0_seq1:231-2594(+)